MGVELPLRVVVTILECCVTFSGVKLSIRSFVLFICSLNLNNPELTVSIVFKIANITSENQSFFDSLIRDSNEKVNAKFITFTKHLVV